MGPKKSGNTMSRSYGRAQSPDPASAPSPRRTRSGRSGPDSRWGHPLRKLARPAPRVLVQLSDERLAEPQVVRMWIEGGLLQIAGPLLLRQVPLGQVQWQPGAQPPGWPTSARAQRAIRLPDGSWLSAIHPGDWDAWLRHRDARGRLALTLRHNIRRGLWPMWACCVALPVLGLAVGAAWWMRP